ncbi:MAG: hypothetical protein QOE33_3780 [Acidobacteriota bacterium]|nr:hypothetical protein [Acidobacteriota bacterium]
MTVPVCIAMSCARENVRNTQLTFEWTCNTHPFLVVLFHVPARSHPVPIPPCHIACCLILQGWDCGVDDGWHMFAVPLVHIC